MKQDELQKEEERWRTLFAQPIASEMWKRGIGELHITLKAPKCYTFELVPVPTVAADRDLAEHPITETERTSRVPAESLKVYRLPERPRQALGWEEDTGRDVHVCHRCQGEFMGNVQRRVCRACIEAATPASVSQPSTLNPQTNS